ncbi:hypothetical protein DUNSADRAFT_619 [Dunaliella salina]|uniref:S1-like domain-containing protein n=1 Tax=Dunaliella salina TaxID=3046 RepID=A0ABQ7FYL9_DUNSA|nr:hypothetical protein DUNSADRAFT_619 [Dunaliella salina]|eukprot:KAF5827458.1 hypothetical protein DUNSADRAFT_619 [Dunaliella salina]
MSRRKHLLQELERSLPALGEEHEVVKVVAPRGGSIVDVERADGTRSLCLMPKKFNRTLWVKRDGFLLIERADGVPPLQPSAPAGVEQSSIACTGAATDSNSQHSTRSNGSGAQGEDRALAGPAAAVPADAHSHPQGPAHPSGQAKPDPQNQHEVSGNGHLVDSSNLGSPPSQSHPVPSQAHPAQSTSAPEPAASHTQQAPEEDSTYAATAGPREHGTPHGQIIDDGNPHCHGKQRHGNSHDRGNPPSQAGALAPPHAPKQAAPQVPSRPAGGTAGGAAVRTTQPAAQGSKIMGTIVAVLYDEQIKQLKRTPGAWPPEFSHRGPTMPTNRVAGVDALQERNNSSDDDSEDGLPPLEKNMNRRIIVHEDSDEDEDESDDDES